MTALNRLIDRKKDVLNELRDMIIITRDSRILRAIEEIKTLRREKLLREKSKSVYPVDCEEKPMTPAIGVLRCEGCGRNLIDTAWAWLDDETWHVACMGQEMKRLRRYKDVVPDI